MRLHMKYQAKTIGYKAGTVPAKALATTNYLGGHVMRTKLKAAVALAAETNPRTALLAGLVPSHIGNSSWPFAQSSDRLTTAILLCTSLLVNGCATRMPASTMVPSVQSWANSSAGSTGNGPTPAERLATVPRIVADEQPVDVSGFEITEEERARLQALHSANRRAGTVKPNPTADNSGKVAEGIAHCLIRGGIVLCPFIAAFGGAAFLTYKAGSVVVGAVKKRSERRHRYTSNSSKRGRRPLSGPV